MSEPEAVFARVVCALDDTPASLDALAQLLRLVPAETPVAAIGVVDIELAVRAGFASGMVEAELERDLRANLAAAEGLDPRVSTRVAKGGVLPSLLAFVEEQRATLVAAGSRGIRRGTGILIGSVTTSLLHVAPCAVLVGRSLADPDAFPSSVVVGLDGSEQSAAAVAAAQKLHERLGVPLEVVVATGGKGVDPDRAVALAPEASLDERQPVAALVDRAGPASLVVVGSRGLHGVRALGSVSERVAHRAGCPVLVVRGSDR